MDSIGIFKGSSIPGFGNPGNADSGAATAIDFVDDKQVKYDEKKTVVEDEMKRMNQLPARSSYVAHRMRVLSKMLQLLSIQRTASEEAELELLFAGLSM